MLRNISFYIVVYMCITFFLMRTDQNYCQINDQQHYIKYVFYKKNLDFLVPRP